MTDFTIASAILYRAGIGWFMATGQSDSGSIYFPIAKKDLDDFLKTSIISVRDGSGFKNLSFDTKQREVLFNFDEAFLGLLEFLRGSECNIDTSEESLTGKILGYQQLDEDGNKFIVSVLSSDGIIYLKPDNIQRITPTNPHLQAKLQEFLAGMVTDSDSIEQKMLRIGLSTESNQEVYVQFLTAVPAWKLSYRLLYAERSSILQIYAIVDNTTMVDFIDAKLVLSTKLPVSFQYDLSTPHNIIRQTIARTTETGIVIEKKSASRSIRRPAAKMAMGAMASGRAYDFEEELDELDASYMTASEPTPSFESQAEIEASTSVEFVLTTPVTIRKNESSMVPLSTIEVTAESKHYYNTNNHQRHPFKIIEFENTEDYAVDEGPISVLDRETEYPIYQGEAMLDRIPAGEYALILYALDRDVDIKQSIDSRTEYIGFEIKGYYYRRQRVNFHVHTFEIVNNTADDIIIYLAIPKSSYTFTQDNLDFKDSYDEYRMIQTIKSQSSENFSYEMQYSDYSDTRLLNYSLQELNEFLDHLELSTGDKRKLNEVIKYKEILQSYESELQDMQKRMDRLSVRRNQIISSLEVLEEGTSDQKVRTSYVTNLTEVDKELDDLTEKIEELEEKIKNHKKKKFS